MSLLNKINELINPETINRLSSITGESSINVEKGLKGAIPTILLALSNKNESDLSSITSTALNTLSNSSQTQNHSSILKSIFGDRLENILFSIADFAGLKQSSMHLIANTSVTSVFESLKSLVPNFDVSSIKNILKENQTQILGLLPAGLATDLGAKTTFDSIKPNYTDNKVHNQEPVRPQSNYKAPEPERTNTVGVAQDKGSNPLKWIIPLLILLAVAFFLWKGCNNKEVVTPINEVDSVKVDEVDTVTINEPTTTTRESLMVELPNGTTLNAYKGGIEEKLVEFLRTDYKALGEAKLKETWFDFDNLNFETGSAVVTADSKLQLDNIVAILKAFPNAKLKIGGYTDKTGNEAVNKKLSADRANTVKSHIEAAGLGKQVDGAEGYGSEFAKYNADAPEEERVLDRHVSVSVR